jgi:hypothetical protein
MRKSLIALLVVPAVSALVAGCAPFAGSQPLASTPKAHEVAFLVAASPVVASPEPAVAIPVTPRPVATPPETHPAESSIHSARRLRTGGGGRAIVPRQPLAPQRHG